MHRVGHHRAIIRQGTLLHSLLLFLFIRCSYTDSLTVRVPASHLTAARGHSVVLGCEFSPNLEQKPDLSSLVVIWQRQEDNHVVHSFYYEQDQLDKQNSAYWNRTALFVTELSKGNASVKIENVGVQDAGHYLCTVSTSQGTDKAGLQLDYGAFYTEPSLTVNTQSSDIVVQYETKGFPAPEVTWEGEHGKILSNHITTSMQLNEKMGLYYITSSYTAPNTPLNFTFTLKNQLLDQYLQRLVSYTGEQKSCFNEATALAVISVILILALVILAWMCHLYNKK